MKPNNVIPLRPEVSTERRYMTPEQLARLRSGRWSEPSPSIGSALVAGAVFGVALVAVIVALLGAWS